MKIFRILIVTGILSGCLVAGYYFWSIKRVNGMKTQTQDESLVIRAFEYESDHQAIDDLFRKGDNFYWMYQGPSDQYSVDFMLRYNTSSQHSKNRDLTLKVATLQGKIVGFLAYYPHSAHVWQLLFLLVDQDFRRQGIARKLLDFAVHDMVRHGAYRITIGTRDNNFRAQNLYQSYGCKPVNSDVPGFVYFSWHKPTS